MRAKQVLSGIFTELIIISAALMLGGCFNVFEPPAALPVSDGKGTVTITIAGNSVKTLMPDIAFSEYNLNFYQNNVVCETINTTPGQIELIELDAGSWTVETTAIVSTGSIRYEAAKGLDDFEVTAGENKNIIIHLNMADNGGNGKFTYNIPFPEGVTVNQATLTMTSLPGGSIRSYDLLSTTEGGMQTVILPSGYYLMTINAVSGYQSAGKTDIVHIYPGTETSANGAEPGDDYYFSADDFTTSVFLTSNAAGAAIDSAHNSPGYTVQSIRIYRDAAGISFIGEAAVSSGSWSLLVPLSQYSETMYARMVLYKNGGAPETLLSKMQPFSIGIAGGPVNLNPASLYTVTTGYISGTPTTIGSIEATIASITGDTFTGTNVTAIEGTSIVLTVVPGDPEKYFLREALQLTADAAAWPYSQVPGSQNQYSFTMPAADVTAKARFGVITDLQNIVVTGGTATPPATYSLNLVFDPNTTAYSLNMATAFSACTATGSPNASTLKITPLTPANGDVSITYLNNGVLWESGSITVPSNSSSTITIQVKSALAGDNDGVTDKSYTVKFSRGTAATLPAISAFSVSAANNPNHLKMNLGGTIDSANNTITLTFPTPPTTTNNSWRSIANFYWYVKNIDNLQLRATFTASPGATVRAGGQVQTSASSPTNGTANDIFRNNIYTVSTAAESREYRVILDIPQMDNMQFMHIQIPTSLPAGSTLDNGRLEQGSKYFSESRPWVGADYVLYDKNCVPLSGGTLELHVRGNSTSSLFLPKLPYALKTGSAVNFLGMPSSKRWNLLANVFDMSSIRSSIAFKLGSVMNGMSWTPRTEPVVVFMNDQYLGLYDIVESLKLDEMRVPVTNIISASNPDGGYLLEIDYRADELNTPFRFRSKRLGNAWWIDYDDEGETTVYPWFTPADPDTNLDSTITANGPFKGMSVINKIKADIERMEDALVPGGNFNNIPDHSVYENLIDVDSFVDWYLLEEFFKNIDSQFQTSVFIHYNPDTQKFHMGPIWDFDLSIGNDGWENYDPNGFMLKDYTENDMWWPGADRSNSCMMYYDQLFRDPWFKQTVKNRWNNHMKWEIQTLLNVFIDEQAAKISRAQSRNFTKYLISQNNYSTFWPNFNGTNDEWFEKYLTPPYYNYPPNGTGSRVVTSAAGEVAYIKAWMQHRLNWLETAINSFNF